MENQKQQVVERLKKANNVLVTVSRNPSVDQLAAAIGLTLLLNKMDKHATAVFGGDTPSTIEFLQPEKTIEKNTDSLRDFIISLDKSKADKLRYKVEDQMVKIFITPYHTSINEADLVFSQGDFNVDAIVALGVHEQNDLDDAITAHGRILHDATVISVNTNSTSTLGAINWSEPKASSLCEMMVDITSELKKDAIDAQMSTAFLTGIVAETNRFSNEKTSSHTMTMSATLMGAGANQQLIATKLEEHAAAKSEPEQDNQEPENSADEVTSEQDGAIDVTHEEPEEQSSSPDEPQDDSLITIDEHGTLHPPERRMKHEKVIAPPVVEEEEMPGPSEQVPPMPPMGPQFGPPPMMPMQPMGPQPIDLPMPQGSIPEPMPSDEALLTSLKPTHDDSAVPSIKLEKRPMLHAHEPEHPDPEQPSQEAGFVGHQSDKSIPPPQETPEAAETEPQASSDATEAGNHSAEAPAAEPAVPPAAEPAPPEPALEVESPSAGGEQVAPEETTTASTTENAPATDPEPPLTLSDLEKEVSSPHIDEPLQAPAVEETQSHADAARQAVEDAINSQPESQPPKPVQALNAQPVDLQSPGEGMMTGGVAPIIIDPDGQIKFDNANDAAAPAEDKKDEGAPPPVPPPLMPPAS